VFNHAFAARRPTVQTSHIGFRPGFIEKNQTRRVHVGDGPFPTSPLIGYVLSLLFRRHERLFLSVTSNARIARSNAEMLIFTPNDLRSSFNVASGRFSIRRPRRCL
jgi:hypothetical protein